MADINNSMKKKIIEQTRRYLASASEAEKDIMLYFGMKYFYNLSLKKKEEKES